MPKLNLKYIYSYYCFDELLDSDVKEESIEIDEPKRFTLYLQEDSSFIVSELKEDHVGKFVIVTYPNKDNVLIYENDETELLYDEFFESMGNNNHNVYEGVFSLSLE